MSRVRRATLRGLLVVALPLFVLTLAIYGAALLQNGDFEDGFHSQPGIDGEVADNWIAYNEAGNPTYLGTQTFAGGGWVEKIEGSNSHIILAENLYPEGLPFTAVLYQLVSGVVPGIPYSASGWFLSLWGGSAGDDPTDPYAIGKKIGIDPTGGTDPTASTVVWSIELWRDKSWVNPGVAAYAAGTNLTVFARVYSKWQQSANQALVDGFRLEEAPTATLSALPAVRPSPVTVRWAGNLPTGLQTLGNFALFYDVDVRTGGGDWQHWLKKTRSITATYAGVWGHTYAFRVLPYAIQPKGEDPLYWPPSTFPGPVSNVVSTTLDGAPPESWVHPLPLIQQVAPFTVTWDGQDDATGIAGYTIQYRVGAGDWNMWLGDVITTTAVFGRSGLPVPPAAGETYAFRSRARDGAGQVEAYPQTPDTTTTLVAYLISGTVRDLRDRPVAGARVHLVPAPAGLTQTIAGVNGAYLLGVTAGGYYSLTASHPSFGPAAPRMVELHADRTAFDLFLPPPDNVVRNSGFETGDLCGWRTVGAGTDSTAFSGDWATRLGPGSAATISQTVSVPSDTLRPTLSFIYRPAGPATFSDALHLRIAGVDQVLPLTMTGWLHTTIALESYQVTGKVFPLEFSFQPAGTSGFGVLLDDVWIGTAPPPPKIVFLPLIKREP